jgi:hypothetical protein
MAKNDGGGAKLNEGSFDYKGLTLRAQERVYDTWLLQRCKIVEGDTIYRMLADANTGVKQPYIKTRDTVAQGTAEGATSTEQNYTFGAFSPNFITFRSLQTVTNELLQDSDAMDVLTSAMAGEIAQKVQGYLLDRIGSDLAESDPANRMALEAVNNPTFVTLRQMLSGTGASGAGTGSRVVAQETEVWNCEERKRILIASHPSLLERFFESNSTGSAITRFQSMVMVEDGTPAPIYEVPWYTDASMPLAATISPTPQVLIFDPQRVLLVSKGLVIRVDTESRMAYNQSVIHATFRAAGALMQDTAAAGIYTADPEAA